MKWVDSLGQLTPVITGVESSDGDKDKEAEIFELRKACDEMKPVLIFFNKPKDLLAFGKKARKDPAVDACQAMDKDLWKRIAITERAKEFVCIRVNITKADKQLLKKHRVSRAPVVALFDFYLKQITLFSSPKLNYNLLGKWMDRAEKAVEKEVRKLAKSKEDTPLVQRAKKRAKVLDQRKFYEEGAKELDRQKWSRAEEKFNKAIELAEASEWLKKAKVGLIEIKAGKKFHEAEKLYKIRRFKECKKALETILRDYKEAKYFGALAKEKLKAVNKKM